MSRRVLMVAYHFPPLAGSSGIQRTLRFVQHLPDFGWEAVVLTAATRAYERTSDDLLKEIPPHTPVCRAMALDASRHLAIAGKYPAAFARPDRWISWRFDGVRQGMKLIRALKPSVIWSTYPIATAHVIGAELHRRSGLPWIADFRDPMAQPGYPTDPITWQSFDRIERDTIALADVSFFTTPSAAKMYRARYPARARYIDVLENGYDEASFHCDAGTEARVGPLIDGCLTLLHSGIVYPQERDPTQLMAALQQLALDGAIKPGKFRIRFRAPVAGTLLLQLAQRFDVMPYIEVLPPIGYREALTEMRRAAGLLVMQAQNCNEQIPAKIYEYLRAGQPIICLSHSEGDTWSVLRQAGCTLLAALDDAEGIAALLRRWIEAPESGRPDNKVVVTSASRQARTQVLAEHLDRLAKRT